MFLPFRHVNHLWHLLTAGFLLLFGVGQAAVFRLDQMLGTAR
jgi:hypothetical protein